MEFRYAHQNQDRFASAMDAVIDAQYKTDAGVLDASIITANMEARNILRSMSTDEVRHLCLLDMICFWGLHDPPCYTGGHSKRLLRECYIKSKNDIIMVVSDVP